MKRIISFLLIVAVVALMLPAGSVVFAAGGNYKQLTSYSDKGWSSNFGSEGTARITAYNVTPTENNMAAYGYTVTKAGNYDFSVGLLVDAASSTSVAAGARTFGFMILEKNSNTIIYPSSSSSFYSIDNTDINKSVSTDVSGSYSAKAGDEIIFLVKSEVKGSTPSLQVIAEIYSSDGSGRSLVASNYDGFSNSQGKNGWHYYSVAESGFTMPTVSKTAATEKTNGFVEMKHFNQNWWWVSTAGQSDTTSPFYGMSIGTHTQPPAPGYMTARGYTVKNDGKVTFSGTVLLDINANMNCKENEDLIGFMVIEKRSNTVLYPADSTDFKVFKNTKDNRTTPTALSGSFEAKAGDELLFITKNLSKTAKPSVQVIMNVYQNDKLIANTHENFSGTQGKNGWRNYYASNDSFKTPSLPAKDIFKASAHKVDGISYLSAESVTDPAVKSFNTFVENGKLTFTDRYSTAFSYKAEKSGKFSFSFDVSVKSEDAELGFAVVKKSNFAFLYPKTSPEYKKITANDGKVTLKGSVNAVSGDEYLFVFISVKANKKSEADISVSVAGKEQDSLLLYFAPTEDIYTYMLNSKETVSSYIDESAPGFKDIVIDPTALQKFDEEKWMWYVNAWADPASDAYMALQMENANVANPKYSMIRSYTAQTDCTISVYGNLFAEIPEFLGVSSAGKDLDFAVCNSKGQIIFPEDRSGFYTFSANELTAEKPYLLNVSCDIRAGEKVYIIFRNRSKADFAYVYNHFQIFETPVGENPTVPVSGCSDGFSDVQGDNGWNYYYALSDSFRFAEPTEFEKLPGSIVDKPSIDEQDGKTDVVAHDNKTLYKIIFFVSTGLDLTAITLLAIFIILKFRKRNAPLAED